MHFSKQEYGVTIGKKTKQINVKGVEKMKKKVLLSLVILFALALAACAPAAEEAAAEEPAAEEAAAEEVAEEASTEPIKVANLSPLTGPVPTFGESTTNGFQLAVDEWNAKGGVLGREIEAIIEDSQCTADPAVNAANKVIDQDGAKFIVGEVCSSASIPVSEVAVEKGIFQISPTSTNTDVTLKLDGTTKDTVFRACFIDPFQGLVMAKFATDQGYTKAFVMSDQGNDYVRGLAEVFAEEFVNYGRRNCRSGNLHRHRHRLLGHSDQGCR